MVDTRLQRRKDGEGWDWRRDGYGKMGVCMDVTGLGWSDGTGDERRHGFSGYEGGYGGLDGRERKGDGMHGAGNGYTWARMTRVGMVMVNCGYGMVMGV